MAASTSPKDTLALGRVIVRELEIDERGELLQRWMAHHLAAVLDGAEHATGEGKTRLEAEAVDLILKLWALRRALPDSLDPLSAYQPAIRVLKLLHPQANPFGRFNRGHGQPRLLVDLFEAMSRSFVAALELTGNGRVKELSEAELAHLAPDEAELLAQLEEWRAVLSRPAVPRILIVSPTGGATAGEVDGLSVQVDVDGSMQENDPGAVTTDLHEAVASNLRQFHADLGKLIDQWEAKQ